MIGAIGLLMVAVAAPAASPVDDAWCARARELIVDAPLSGAAALARFEQASALFDVGSPVAARARAVVGAEGDFAAAFSVLAAAAGESCAARSDDDPAVTAAAVRELMARDPRFAGVRRGDDLLDRLRHTVFMWFSRLLESEGMQRFAGNTRTIFFVALAVVATVLAVRVARRLRRRTVTVAVPGPGQLDAERAEAFAVLRAQAAERLRRKDARGALLLGARALLVRAGEVDTLALRAARTHREVVAALVPSVALVVSPALRAFEQALYAKDATDDDAARFLALVDEAAIGVAAAAASVATAARPS